MINNQDDSYGPFLDDRDDFMNVHSVPSGKLYRLQRQLDNANEEDGEDEEDEDDETA